MTQFFANDVDSQRFMENMERIDYWFRYIADVCKNSTSCEECPFVGHQLMETDVGTLGCENGRDKRKKG